MSVPHVFGVPDLRLQEHHGCGRRIKPPERRFRELEHAHGSGANLPFWLAHAARARWGSELAIRPASEAVLVRDAPVYGHSRASWEINLGCDLDCGH